MTANASSEAPVSETPSSQAPGANRPDPQFRILGTLLAMTGGDTSLELVEALTDALLQTPSYALAAQLLALIFVVVLIGGFVVARYLI